MASLQDNSQSSPQASDVDEEATHPVLLGSSSAVRDSKLSVKNTFIDFDEDKKPSTRRNRTCPALPERKSDDEHDQDSGIDVEEAPASLSPAGCPLDQDPVEDTIVQPITENDDESEADVSPAQRAKRRAMFRTEELQEQFFRDSANSCPQSHSSDVVGRIDAVTASDVHQRLFQVTQESLARVAASHATAAQSKERVDLEKALGFDGALTSAELVAAHLSKPVGIMGDIAAMPTAHPPPGYSFRDPLSDMVAYLAAANLVPPYHSPYAPAPLPFPLPLAPPSMPMWPPLPPPSTLASCSENGGISADRIASTHPQEHETFSTATRTRQPRRAMRLWIHIYLHMKVPGFDLVPMLIGRQGCKMRRIAEATGAKIRIRGRGSGHYEIDGKQEAPTPLMVAVTTDQGDRSAFETAIRMTLVELRSVEERFKVFCSKEKVDFEGPAFSIGLLTPGSEHMFSEVLEGVPLAATARSQ